MMGIYKYFNFPNIAKINQKIFKKNIYDKANLNTKQKDIFKNDIESIVRDYVLSPKNVNIPVYKDEQRVYEEIEIFSIELRNKIDEKQISEIIMRLIPYPCLIIFKFEDEYKISAAHQRLNNVDASKNVLEQIHITNWFKEDEDQNFLEKLDVKNIDQTNYYTIYSEYIIKIIIFNASKSTGIDLNEENIEQIEQLKKEIDAIEEEMITLKNKIKKESRFSEKMDLNIKIKNLEQSLSKKIENLKSFEK
jgi:hypothetical protein